MLTAAPGEASRAHTHIAAALRVLALAPVLRGNPQKSGQGHLGPPLLPVGLGGVCPGQGQWLGAARRTVRPGGCHLAGSVPAGGAVGDAVCREVEVMEDDLLALDAQLSDTAWWGGWVGRMS